MKDVLLMLAGAVISAAVGWLFYTWSGDDLAAATKELRAETDQLKALNNTMMLALQNMQAGAKIDLAKDENGNYTRMGVTAPGGILTVPGAGHGGDPALK